MKKYTFFLFLLFMLSCNNRTQRNDNISMEECELLADSTRYNIIVEAWKKRDTAALRPFFESWYQHTLKNDCTLDVPYRTVMDTIVRVIYENSFFNTPPPEPELEFYLSNGIPVPEKTPIPEDNPPNREPEPGREYAIFSRIYYSVIDTTLISFEERDRVWGSDGYFRPDETLFGRKIIILTDPLYHDLETFLFDYDSYEEKRDKLNFIKYYIKGSFNYYIEEPNVHILILNKEFDAAYVEYYEMGSRMVVWLVKRDGRWIITKSETRGIS